MPKRYVLQLKVIGGPITGDSKVEGYEGWIDVSSWSLNTPSHPSGNWGSGRWQAKELHLVTLVSRASTRMAMAANSGEPVDAILLSLDENDQELVRIEINDGLLSSYAVQPSSGSTDGKPADAFSIFGYVRWSTPALRRAEAIHPSDAGRINMLRARANVKRPCVR